MAWECALGHYFPNLADRKARHNFSLVGTVAGFLLCYYNQLNVAVILGGMLGVRELRFLLGGSIGAELQRIGLYVPAWLVDLPGQQSIWWSSHAPDAYTGKPTPADAEGMDLSHQQSQAPADADRPRSLCSRLMASLKWLVAEAWGGIASAFRSVGNFFARWWSRWQAHWGWDPLPLPLHRQASLAAWTNVLWTVLLYYLSLGVLVTVLLYHSGGNQSPFARWAIDNVTFLFAVMLALRDVDQALPENKDEDDEESKEDEYKSDSKFIAQK